MVSTPHVAMDDRKRAAGIDLGITKKFLEVGKCVNMESTSNEDWLHFVYPVSLHVVIQSA